MHATKLKALALPDTVLPLVAAAIVLSAPIAAWARCGKPTDLDAGRTTIRSLEVDGLTREYRLHLPPGYDPSASWPVVLNVHGYTGTAEGSENEWNRMSAHADEEGYVVVYPQSTSFSTADTDFADFGPVTSWNDGACSALPGTPGLTCDDDAFRYPCPPECGSCGPCNWCSCHDDVAFIEALLDRLEEEVCVDVNRVYAVGYSNGGMFVHRLGCALPERFAAIAPLHGTLARGFDCRPEPSVSILLMGGAADRTVPVDGGRSSDGYYYEAQADVARTWAEANACSSTSTAYPTRHDGTDGLSCAQHAACRDGVEVVHCVWDGAHDWPESDEPWGNELLWSFFRSHARSR